MLSTDKENLHSIERGGAGGVKERHVKRLNFGQPILQLSSANELEAGSKERRRIGSVHREDLVRNWLDSHTEDVTENISVYPLSPVCGTYVSHLLQSPVLGSRSRRRTKVFVAANSDDTDRNSGSGSRTAHRNVRRIDLADICGGSSKDTRRSKVAVSPVLGKVSSISRTKRKNGETRASVGHPSTPLKTTDIILSSPVNDTSFTQCKRRKNFSGGTLNTSKRSAKIHYIDTNMNSVGLIRSSNNRLCCESKHVSRTTSIEPRECKNSQSFPILNLCKSESQGHLENTHSDDKEYLQIETTSSDEDPNENTRNSLRYSSESEKTMSDLIEDDESQHLLKTQDIPSFRLACVDTRQTSETAITYKGEMHDIGRQTIAVLPSIVYPDLQTTSQQASQAATPSSKATDDVSNPVDFAISVASSPPRIAASITMCTNLLDSGKKRRKPRKGSLVARLQLLINREKSFLRIWQHQMKSAESDKIHAPCIVFCVEKYFTHFDKCFLEGAVIEDSFNLLTNVSWITVIIVSEIIDILRIESGNALRIYPPWDVVSHTGTTMIPRKLSVVPSSNNINIQCAIEKTATKNIIHDHACRCIMEDTIVPDCKALHSCVKPDVLMYILEA